MTELYLSENQITNLSPLLGLVNLTELDLSENQITDLSPLSGLVNLTQLNVTDNQIINLSPLSGLVNLTELYLSSNQITDLSPLSSLVNLTQLNVTDNQIINLSPLSGLVNLTKLYLDSNNITDLSPLSVLANLTQLDLSDNQITDLRPLSGLVNLTQLEFHANKITDLSPLSGLAKLTELYLSESRITDLSPLSGLVNLTQLDLGVNEITNLLPLSGLTNLTRLDLGRNEITDLSPLSGLANLTRLDLGRNEITDLSPLSGLVNLMQLNLTSNPITDLTPLLLHYQRNIHIEVANNPITNPPPTIIEQGSTAIKKWLERQQQEKQIYLYEAKMLLVGQGGVGKSSLLFRLKNPNSELPKIDRTRGVHIEDYSFKYGSKNFKTHVWDFGGQDIYYELHRFFLTDNALYLLMTDTRTDQGAKIEEWLHTIELFSDNKSPIILVQNVFDNAPLLTLDLNNYLQHYSIYENRLLPVTLKEKASHPNFMALEKAIQHKVTSLPHIAEPIWSSWQKVRQDLATLANKKALIDYNVYVHLCNKHNLTEIEEQKVLCRYLHNLGILLWYNQPNNRFLRRKVILNPQWLLDPIYLLIDSKMVKDNNGKCTADDIANLWHDCEQRHYQDELIELMKEFRLCYQYKHQADTFIIPSLMANGVPAAVMQLEKDIQDNVWRLTYRYKRLMPRGIVNQLAAELHRYITHDFEHVWAFGVVLKSSEATAIVKADTTSKEISIAVTGNRRDFLLGKIRQALDDIHDTYSKRLQLEIMLPCTCANCKNDPNPSMYSYYNDIIPEITDGRMDIHCRKTRNYIHIKSTLQNVGFALPYDLQQLLPPDTHPAKVFICYASEDLKHVEELHKYLSTSIRNKTIESVWYDRQILAGKDWNDTIQEELDKAGIVFMMVSSDFLNIEKNYIWEKEMPKIIKRHKDNQVLAIPIILRACDWEGEEYISSLQVVAATDPNTNERIPLLSAANKDEAFTSAAKQINAAIEAYRKPQLKA